MARPDPQLDEATSPLSQAGLRARPLPARIGAAIGLAAISTLLTFLFHDHITSVVFIFFYPAVVFAAWYGGFVGGAVVAVLGIFAVDAVFLGGFRQFAIPSAANLLIFGLFLFLSAIVALLVHRMRAAQAQAEAREREAQELAARLTHQAAELETQATELELNTVELEQTMEEAQLAREEAEKALQRSEIERRRVSILAETSRALTESTDYRERLRALARLVVRELADYCIIDLIEDAGRIVRFVTEAHDPARLRLIESLGRYTPRMEAVHGAGAVLRTGEPDIMLRVPNDALQDIATSEAHLEVIRALDPTSIIIMPLNASSRRLGAITLVRAGDVEPFEPDDVELARVMATRAALLVEMARLYREAMIEIERRRAAEAELQEKADELEALNVEQEETLAALEQRTEQAEAAERAAQEASAAKSQFLAVMSHELRTPLNAIMGYTDLIQSGAARMELSDTGRNFLDRIRSSVLHLRGLIDEVLSLSRIEAGKEDIALERVNLAALLREVAAMVQTDALRKGLRVGVEIESDVIATTDPGKVRQIVINLASNAVKFTDQGSVRLCLQARRSTASIEVVDTGSGIAAEHLERVFEPFEQVDKSRTRRVGGTGLGLAVSRRLARLLGGDVLLDSSVGAGSTFTLLLPLEPPGESADPQRRSDTP